MGLVVHRSQAGHCDMGVKLGGGQAGMAKQLLHDAQVSTTFDQMGRRAVPQPMRSDVGRARHRRDGLVHHRSGLSHVKPPSTRP